MEFITTNGKVEVKIEAASFKDAVNLKKAAMKALKDAGLLDGVSINIGENTNILNKLSEVLLNLDTSDDFEKAVFDCLKYCIYDFMGKNIKITPQLFDDIPEAREDYYEIVTKCCEVNLRPFFNSLITELKTRFGQMETNTPEQK